MAINESRLRVAEFDFDEVKDNFKTFLKAQTQFTDYDFEGSGMNILLDVLAYNTHYLGFNANMLANEMFLDSASIRSSVTSHAKTLGYIPTSARASKATVDVILNTSISSVTSSPFLACVSCSAVNKAKPTTFSFGLWLKYSSASFVMFICVISGTPFLFVKSVCLVLLVATDEDRT